MNPIPLVLDRLIELRMDVAFALRKIETDENGNRPSTQLWCEGRCFVAADQNCFQLVVASEVENALDFALFAAGKKHLHLATDHRTHRVKIGVFRKRGHRLRRLVSLRVHKHLPHETEHAYESRRKLAAGLAHPRNAIAETEPLKEDAQRLWRTNDARGSPRGSAYHDGLAAKHSSKRRDIHCENAGLTPSG